MQFGLKKSNLGQNFTPCLFLSLLKKKKKRKNTAVLLGKFCLKAAVNKLSASIQCHKQAKTLAR